VPLEVSVVKSPLTWRRTDIQVRISTASSGLLADPVIVVVAAKSTSDASKVTPFPPDPNSLQSTISTVEREIREAGGKATAIAVDTRDFESVQKLVDSTVKVRMLLRAIRIMSDIVVDLRSYRRPHLQLGSNMVGINREYTNEALPTHAACQS
jgi:hypothetical protein